MSAVPESVHWIFLPQVEITTQYLFYLRLRYFLPETFGSILSYVVSHTFAKAFPFRVFVAS